MKLISVCTSAILERFPADSQGLAGQKHPTLMGQSYKIAWAEIWEEVKDVFENARITGQATMKDDDCLFMKRNGFLEETYFSWSIIPMVGEDGTVMGLYNPAFEKVTCFSVSLIHQMGIVERLGLFTALCRAT